MDTVSFILSVNNNKTTKDLQNLNGKFLFRKLKKDHELFSKKKKVMGKFKKENSKNVFIDEFICLRSKAYSVKCGSDNKKR